MAIDTQSKTGVIASTGIGEILFSPSRGQRWLVQQFAVDAPNVGGSAACAIYLNGKLITPMVPQADAAAGDPPVPVGPTSVLKARWTGATVGAQIDATIIFDDGTG